MRKKQLYLKISERRGFTLYCLFVSYRISCWMTVEILISAGCRRGGCAICLFTICLQLRVDNKNLVNIVLQFCPH